LATSALLVMSIIEPGYRIALVQSGGCSTSANGRAEEVIELLIGHRDN
jgi:hypothetical protein